VRLKVPQRILFRLKIRKQRINGNGRLVKVVLSLSPVLDLRPVKYWIIRNYLCFLSLSSLTQAHFHVLILEEWRDGLLNIDACIHKTLKHSLLSLSKDSLSVKM
jgi:hypothetical protein